MVPLTNLAELIVLALVQRIPAPSHIAAPFSPLTFTIVLPLRLPSLTLALATRLAFEVADVFFDQRYPWPLGAILPSVVEPPPLPASAPPLPASVPPPPPPVLDPSGTH